MEQINETISVAKKLRIEHEKICSYCKGVCVDNEDVKKPNVCCKNQKILRHCDTILNGVKLTGVPV